MLVLLVPAGHTAAEYKSTMWNSAVVCLQLFFRNEVNRCIVICEIVRHCLDFFLNFCRICALFKHYEALSCMLLSCCKLWILAVTNCLKCGFYRNRILLGILDTCDTTDGIGMSLTDTLAPECVIISLRKQCISVQAVQ